ncbi:alpha/beta hydrolase [Roseibium sp. CAU 1637]|uniref:Alpha/beta hydrolase n=1 Tax=Roseibium limicola TaxID=2816037 RepID=A0A939J846_9HYPH|nr:alpha/beta hydrolase [Roseibium limicola]
MKISEADILLIPGYGDTPKDHWMRRWQGKMATAQVVEQKSWFKPVLKLWQDTLLAKVEQTERPVVLVGHSLGCHLIAHASLHWPKDKVVGAYLVCPPNLERTTNHPAFDVSSFLPIPHHPIKARTHVVASQNDPYGDFKLSEEFARKWGATFQDAGQAGHVNMESGHGPWPEGLLSFAHFMKRLGSSDA